MKVLFILLFVLLRTYLSVVPNWDFTTSVTDLLSSDSVTYTIDERSWWYDATDKLEKTIKKENGKIIFENKFTFKEAKDNGATKFYAQVPFESIESFYLNVDSETSNPIVCPRGSYNPFEVKGYTNLQEIGHYNNDWIKNSKFDLKCYYHREEPFLVFYLMNEESYVLRLKGSTLSFYSKFKFGDDVKEIFDFKLQNRENRGGTS